MMSALSRFGLKYPALLKFERSQCGEVVRHNPNHPYGVAHALSDPSMRERLDEVDPVVFERACRRLFALLQRGKELAGFEASDGRHVLSVDGMGLFSWCIVLQVNDMMMRVIHPQGVRPCDAAARPHR